MRRIMTFCGIVAGVLCLFLVSSSAEGATQETPQPGDVVEVRRTTEWEAAEVLDVLAGGRVVRVKIVESGHQAAVPMRRVRASSSESQDRSATTATTGLRSWTDKTGNYKVDAKPAKFDGETVFLEKRDGSTVEVPLDKLSADDIAFVAKSSVSGGSEPENPFSSSSSSNSASSGGASARSNAAADSTTDVRLTAAKRQTARQVIPSVSSQAVYEPDVFESPDTAPLDQPVSFSTGLEFFEKVTGIHASREAGAIFVARTNGPPGQPATSHLDIVDLETPGAEKSVSLPPETSVLDAIGREPTRILTRSAAFGFGGKSRLDVWELQQGKSHTRGIVGAVRRFVQFPEGYGVGRVFRCRPRDHSR